MFTSSGGILYKWDDLERPRPLRVGKVPRGAFASGLGHVRLVTRLLRLGISHLVLDATPPVAISDKRVFVGAGLDSWHPIGQLTRGPLLAPGGRPMRFGAAACRGEVLVGEYRSNPQRVAVTLYAVADNRLTSRWQFPAGTVRHIHSVQTDPYSGNTWVATGDYGRECRVLRSRDGMRTADLIGCGDQTWRSAAFLFDESAVYWGMDSPLERCFVFRWDKSSGCRSVVEELPGPIWHASTNDNGWLSFATAVEPSRLFREPYAYIYAGRRGSARLREIARFEKDRWSMRWFQPGLIFFPAGVAPADYLVYSGSGLRDVDDVMVIGRLAE